MRTVRTNADGIAPGGTAAVAAETMPTCWPIQELTGDDADTDTATKWRSAANFSRQTRSAGTSGRNELPTMRMDA